MNFHPSWMQWKGVMKMKDLDKWVTLAHSLAQLIILLLNILQQFV